MKRIITGILLLLTSSLYAQKNSQLPQATGTGKGGSVTIVQSGISKKILTDSIIAPAKKYADSLQAVINGLLSNKQATLVSGTNIKTINGVALPGSGNIQLNGNDSVYVDFTILNDSNVVFRRMNGGRDTLTVRSPQNITGLITPGTNVTLTGNGTVANPYVISSVGGSGSDTTKWQLIGNNIYNTNSGNVYIGATTGTGQKFEVTRNGNYMRFGDGTTPYIELQGSVNYPGFRLITPLQEAWLFSIGAGGPNFSINYQGRDRFVIRTNGQIDLGGSFGNPNLQVNINGDILAKRYVTGTNAIFSNLATGLQKPTTTGILKPTVSDATGQLSFLDEQIVVIDTTTTTSNIIVKSFTLSPYTITRFQIQALAVSQTTSTGSYDSRKSQIFLLNGTSVVTSGTLRDLEPNQNLGSIAAGLNFTMTVVGNDVRITLINNGQGTDWKLIIKIDTKSTLP